METFREKTDQPTSETFFPSFGLYIHLEAQC